MFDKHGKWMDGWESRRKRTPGHDYLIIKIRQTRVYLKSKMLILLILIGNQPSMISIEACNSKIKIILKILNRKTLSWKKKDKS